ncbi:MAG: hypothetical protein AAGI01_04115, partial [Myxococcota bacterium]
MLSAPRNRKAPAPGNSRRAVYLLAALALTVTLVCGALGLRYVVFLRTPALGPAESVTFVIPSGASWAEICEVLVAHDLV